MQVKLKRSGPGMKKILAGVEALKKAKVYVGIPQADERRTITGKAKDGGGGKDVLTNAEALFLFSKGSPLRGIEPREVIEPAIQADGFKQPIAKQIGLAQKDALAGDMDGMMDHLDRAGTIGEGAAKKWFKDPRNGWHGNKPATIRRKLRKLKGKAKKDAYASLAAGDDISSLDTPGIDTGQMRRAITHITDKEGDYDGGVDGANLDPDQEIVFGEAGERSTVEAIGETFGEAAL